MKKLMSIVMVALLALGANVSAQEEGAAAAGGGSTAAGTAATATIGGIATSTVVIGAVAVGVAAAIIANQDDDTPFSCPDGQIQVGNTETCECPDGETLVNGVCVPDGPTFVCDQGGDLIDGVCHVEELVPQTITIEVDGTITTTSTLVTTIRTYLPTRID